jgi:SAM-dependent methyltransferase
MMQAPLISQRKVNADRAARFGQRLDEADLYAFGLRVGLHLLASRRLKRALRYLVQPVPYWRGVEFRLVWNEAGFTPDDRVLDIGSPKLLSLYLAQRVGAEVFATDIDPYFLDEYALLRSARGLSDQMLRLQVEDGRKLSFPDDSFSKVFAVSVIEHIPELGDSDCMREIARVLRPGGRCLLTVPYWPVFKDEYRDADFYWAGASISTPDGRVFFQRRYSEPELYKRLIEPSGLTLDRLEYIGERVLVRSQREFGDFLLPPTGPVHPILSRLVHTGPARSPRELAKPLCAFIALTKTAA